MRVSTVLSLLSAWLIISCVAPSYATSAKHESKQQMNNEMKDESSEKKEQDKEETPLEQTKEEAKGLYIYRLFNVQCLSLATSSLTVQYSPQFSSKPRISVTSGY